MYVVKRVAVKLKSSINVLNKYLKSKEDQPKALKILERNVNKFFIRQLFSHSSLFPEVYAFDIIYLDNLNYLVVEIFQEYGRMNLNEYSKFKLRDTKFAYELVDKLLKYLKYIEELGCPQNDLKPGNIVIEYDEIMKTEKVRLIDFDIYNFLPYINYTNEEKHVRELQDLFDDHVNIRHLHGYPLIYAAPEIIHYMNLNDN